MMRTIRTLATLVLVFVAASSSSAVGPGDDALIVRTAARLDALTISIYGSADELRAAEWVNYHRIEDGTAACMRAAGRAYRPVPFEPFYRDFTDADVGYGTGRASVVDSLTEHGRRLVRNEEAFARVRRAEAERRVAAADVDTFNTCTAPYEHRAYYDIDLPASAQRLDLDDLVAPLRDLPEVAAAAKPYRSCMRTRGYTVDDRDDFLFSPRPAAPSRPCSAPTRPAAGPPTRSPCGPSPPVSRPGSSSTAHSWTQSAGNGGARSSRQPNSRAEHRRSSPSAASCRAARRYVLPTTSGNSTMTGVTDEQRRQQMIDDLRRMRERCEPKSNQNRRYLRSSNAVSALRWIIDDLAKERSPHQDR